jgi:NADH-quinone oxidoreductase subunit L
MGGLLRRMPITAITFGIASLAICAIPFFSGAYSKDSIISAAFLRGAQDGTLYYGVYALVLFGAVCTALYMGRMFFVVFLGQPRSEHAEHAHESSAFMTIPLIVLGFLSLTAGWVVYGWVWDGGQMTWLMPTQCVSVFMTDFSAIEDGIRQANVALPIEIVDVALAVGFIVFTYFFYGRAKDGDPVAAQDPRLYHVLERHGWFDDFYDWYVAKVQQRFCDILGILDNLLIKLCCVWGTGGVAGLTGTLLKRSYVGDLHAYVYWFLAGVMLFWAYAVGWL